MGRNPAYWKTYHASRINDCNFILNLAIKIVEILGSPWQSSKRGRKPKFLPKEHAVLCIYMRYFDYTYRDTEGITPLLISKTMEHSTVGWAMKRMPIEYIRSALKLLHSEIHNLLAGGVFIADSTGIETDRYGDAMVVLKETKKREFRKLHVIADYFYEHGILSIACAGESSGNSHDSPNFRQIFDPDICKDGLLFGDSAYDAVENFKLAYENELQPVIKPRNYTHTARTKGIRIRRRAAKDFSDELYKKFRGIVEGIFGGLETRYGNKTRCRLEHTRKVSILLMALAHNIKAYARSIVLVEIVRKREQIKCKIYFCFELFDNPG